MHLFPLKACCKRREVNVLKAVASLPIPYDPRPPVERACTVCFEHAGYFSLPWGLCTPWRLFRELECLVHRAIALSIVSFLSIFL